MSEQNKKTIDDLWLDILTGKESLDVTGQFLNEEQLHILEEAEMLREAILSVEAKEQITADEIDIEASKDRLIARLKKDNLL